MEIKVLGYLRERIRMNEEEKKIEKNKVAEALQEGQFIYDKGYWKGFREASVLLLILAVIVYIFI